MESEEVKNAHEAGKAQPYRPDHRVFFKTKFIACNTENNKTRYVLCFKINSKISL